MGYVQRTDPTDFTRWHDEASFDPVWDHRAQFAARFIGPGARVLDLGCGTMALKRFLPAACEYIGCDLVARDRQTIVCNFNRGEFPDDAARSADVITMLGLLEYIEDVSAFFHRLARHRTEFVLSYHPAGIFKRRRRRESGWISHLTDRQLRRTIGKAGLHVLGCTHWTQSQWMYRFAH